ncbi:GAF domain-containing protein [Chloroflexota bacterium]
MTSPHMADRYYRIIVAIVGLAFLIYATLANPQIDINFGIFSLLVITAGVLIQLPILLLKNEISLIPVVALGGGLIAGPLPVAWAMTLGIFCGYTFWLIVLKKRSWRDFFTQQTWINIGYKVGIICIPLILTFSILGIVKNLTGNLEQFIWPLGFWPSFVFMVLYGLLITGSFFFNHPAAPNSKQSSEITTFLSIGILSILFVLLVFEVYPDYNAVATALLTSIPVLVAFLLFLFSNARVKHERRVEELSTLNHISGTIRSTLELDQLLPVIQEQVMQLLAVNNFYVAIYDFESKELWYPIAIKYGQKQNWPRRAMSDRLTDRVIQDGQSILLTPQTISILDPVGLPPSEETPISWLGVPLISSERTIGCLAVFTLKPGTFFTSADVDILTILSGQVSVAIENTLLYEQLQQRAKQLETLNQLTASITSSLNLPEVLTQVCNSVAQVGGSQQSAIFLLEQGDDSVTLAHTRGLDENFQQRNSAFPSANNSRGRCLQTGKPMVIPDIKTSSLSDELVINFQADGIRAFADFPLITPDGQIGFLSVFFNEKHDFSHEEVGMLQTFASQAALAVANARLHAHTDAALAQRINQLTTLEAVGRELSAASHSDQLFNLILKYALQMTNSCCGIVGTFNPKSQNMIIRAAQGYNLQLDEYPINKGITGRVRKNHLTENIGDVTKDPDYIDLRNGDVLSQLSVPIIHENRMLGIITLESHKLNSYSESEESFVTQLANHAAIDIINAELYHETQHRLEEQSTLYQVSTKLVSAVSPNHVAHTISQAIDSVIQPLEIGIYYWTNDSQKYVLIGEVKKHLSAEFETFPELNHHLLQDSSLTAFKSSYTRLGGSESECDNCQIFIYPLEMSQQSPGLVILHLDQNRHITKNETELLKMIVAQGAIALQNAHNFLEAKNGRDRLVTILNSIDEGILMIDTNGNVLLANEPIHVLSGLPVEEFLDAPIFELPDQVLETLGYNKAEITSIINTIHRLQVPISPKTNFEVKDSKRTRVIERITTPIWGHDGAIIGLMILVRDITEEHEIEQTRETITETIVHDLRSPLSAIVGALELLSDTLADSDNPIIEQTLLVGQRSASRVLSLTEALLDIARLQSGRMEIEFQKIDLPALVSELMIEYTALANENSVIIRNDIPDQLPTINADLDKLIRILTNLVDNAINFSPHGGRVVISTNLEISQFLTILVIDSGPGIPLDYRDKIFERFIQVPGQNSRRRGTGLGLAFCRLAVEAHGGKIWVRANPDGGSIFGFSMPIASPKQESTRA